MIEFRYHTYEASDYDLDAPIKVAQLTHLYLKATSTSLVLTGPFPKQGVSRLLLL